MTSPSFRARLDAWRDGKASQADVEAALMAELRADPGRMNATRSLIDAYRSAGFVPERLAERLLSLGSLDPAASANRTLLRGLPEAGAHTVFRPAAERIQSPTPMIRTNQSRPLGPGAILSAQYVLESIVPGGDSGGQGVVYRARDLIQEEAQDRNPYVAIKILGKRIEQDPEALKSLNREYKKTLPLFTSQHRQSAELRARRQLRLSGHGTAGRPVLDRAHLYSRSWSVGGREFCASRTRSRGALGYAHQMHLIHSDFKPSNAFITKDAGDQGDGLRHCARHQHARRRRPALCKLRTDPRCAPRPAR